MANRNVVVIRRGRLPIAPELRKRLSHLEHADGSDLRLDEQHERGPMTREPLQVAHEGGGKAGLARSTRAGRANLLRFSVVSHPLWVQ
jgi:hypothetical protein